MSFRFQTLGLHPALLTRVQQQSLPNVAPGSYNIMQYDDFSEKNVQKRAQGPNWRHALYTEQMAKIPHSTFKQAYEKRKEEERRVGPGTYFINDFITESDRKPRCLRGALDQLTPRFPNDQPVCSSFFFTNSLSNSFKIGKSTTTRCLRYIR
jgi:hypothetical protein